MWDYREREKGMKSASFPLGCCKLFDLNDKGPAAGRRLIKPRERRLLICANNHTALQALFSPYDSTLILFAEWQNESRIDLLL
jgi:hypothetical protein